MAIMGLGLINRLHAKLLDPVLREFAYWVAMIIYYIVAWHPDYLAQIDVKTIRMFAKATRRNHDVSDYFIKIAQTRGF